MLNYKGRSMLETRGWRSSLRLILHINRTTTPDGCIQHIITTFSSYMRSVTFSSVCWYLWSFNLLSVFFLLSWQLGMHLCVAGWMEGGQVGYPTQFPSVKCGDGHVGLVIYKEPVDQSSKYDAYCYRIKGTMAAQAQRYYGSTVSVFRPFSQTALQSSECIQFNAQTQTGICIVLFVLAL